MWAHQDLNLEPTHYECGALTVELWAQKGDKIKFVEQLLAQDFFE